jgi:formiminotetrahydrofolate cyclodeaminase
VTENLFGLPFAEVLRRTSERTPYAGGGAVSAMACASAASLVAMAARYAGDNWSPLVADAEAAITELESLADADAEVFGELLKAWKLPTDAPERHGRVADAALQACRVPLRICEIGAGIAQHATRLVGEGKRDLKGDALTAGYVAHAGVRGAARLVELNARQAKDPMPGEQARALVARTAAVIDHMEERL